MRHHDQIWLRDKTEVRDDKAVFLGVEGHRLSAPFSPREQRNLQMILTGHDARCIDFSTEVRTKCKPYKVLRSAIKSDVTKKKKMKTALTRRDAPPHKPTAGKNGSETVLPMEMWISLRWRKGGLLAGHEAAHAQHGLPIASMGDK